MGDSIPPTTDLAPPLITPHCGQCGYRLEGLPAEGRCPECGESYHPDRIVIAGWGSEGKETGLNGPPERAGKLFFYFIAGSLLIAATEFVRGRAWDGIFYLFWFAVIAAVGMYNRWRLISDYVVGAHARIFPEGFAQRDGFGPCKLHPWSTAGRVTLEPAANGRYSLRITSSTVWTLPVSIEFECDEAKAARLREAIDRFKNVRR